MATSCGPSGPPVGFFGQPATRVDGGGQRVDGAGGMASGLRGPALRHSACETDHVVIGSASEMASQRSNPLARVVDALQGRGRYAFTRDEVAEEVSRSLSGLDQALWRLRDKGRLVSPRRGSTSSCRPSTGRRAPRRRPGSSTISCGSWTSPTTWPSLSAASLHGAAHQQPMVFQVMTDRPTRPARAGRVRISFHMSRSVEATPVTKVQTETGHIPVSTPEVTALDLVRFHAASGHMSNVATVISELAEGLDAKRLGEACAMYATPVVQRLGFLLDGLGHHGLSEAVATALDDRRLRSVKLVPGARGRARKTDPTWRVIVNATVDVEA